MSSLRSPFPIFSIRERDMSAMDSGRWRRVSGHLDRVLDLPPHARDACVAALRMEDPDAAAEVAALLEEHRRLTAEGFLDARRRFTAGDFLEAARIRGARGRGSDMS
jgi:hypothetical protein